MSQTEKKLEKNPKDNLEKKPEPQANAKKSLWRSVLLSGWHVLSRHTATKLVALFIAVLLWSVLIASDATLTREKVFNNVEVTVLGQDSLKSRSLIVLEDVAALMPTVKIRAEVTQGSYQRVTGANYGPRIDLSRLRQTGEQQVAVTMASTSYGQVLEVDPPYVTVTVARYINRGRIPVVVETHGRLIEGRWADTPRVDPMLVSVGGPEAMVEQVYRVVAKLDLGILTGKTTLERNAVPFEVQDAQGNVLDSPLLQITNDTVILDSVAVEVASYAQRPLPVELNGAVEGAPAEGYELVELRAEPSSVLVAASAEVLESLSRAFVDVPLKIEGEAETVSAAARIKRMADVKHMNTEEVVLTAVIREKTVERTLRGLPVDISGLPDAYTAKLSASKLSLNLTGAYHWLRSLAETDVLLAVDVAGLSPGTYTVPVRVRIDNAPEYAALLEQAELSVTIAEKAAK